MKKAFPFLSEDADRHGNVRLYVRRNGRKVRLRVARNDPTFADAYAKAIDHLGKAKTEPVKEHTLGWLVAEFEASTTFLKVTRREQRNRHLLVRSILDEETKPGSGRRIGDMPLRFFDSDTVRLLRDRKAATPSAANHRLSNLRVIFNWAMEERSRIVKTNPVVGVKPLQTKKDGGWHTWTEEEIDRYEKRHPTGTMARLALDLMLYTGARRGDVVKLGARNLTKVVNRDTGAEETWLDFRPGKTRKSTGDEVVIPLLRVLLDSLAATVHGLDTFLINAYGKPHASGDSFANWFKDRIREASLPEHCSPHGLRKAGAVRASEAGATPHQMMAIFGWSTERLAAHYAKKANKKKLAASAVHTLSGRSGS